MQKFSWDVFFTVVCLQNEFRMFNCSAEIQAIEDLLLYLDSALSNGLIDLPTFLKVKKNAKSLNNLLLLMNNGIIIRKSEGFLESSLCLRH